MTRRDTFVSATTVLALGLFAALQAQQRAPVEPVAPRPASAPGAGPIGVDQSAAAGMTFRAKEILGAKVSIDANAEVGTVDDLVLDEHGNVDYMIVINPERQLVTIPWDATQFSAEQRLATVHITAEKYKQVPTYTVEQYPVFSAPSYRTQTYQFFGLTPGQERRAVRRITR
jgi:sporulation protein YlmC with PRC-barrel domain